ncbi:MAG: nucleotidyltransferase family protein [Dehalococcoidia bacterium]|nr:nucleotidyltransferase family protein [Dehalococcoidia bacterium]
MATIAALLLAAGESTRMGETKALLPWHDRPLIEHQISTLASAGVSRTIVVLGHQSDRLKPLLEDRSGIQWVYNPDYKQGKTTSIKAGLHALKASSTPPATGEQGEAVRLLPEESILILNADQPRSADTIRRVMELHRRADSAKRTCLITIPTYGGKGGHPIILSLSLVDELMDISEDKLGVKDVVHRHVKETQRVEIDCPEILLDLNTPQDYRKALETPSSYALTKEQRLLQ